jgi:lipase chaperone LimK
MNTKTKKRLGIAVATVAAAVGIYVVVGDQPAGADSVAATSAVAAAAGAQPQAGGDVQGQGQPASLNAWSDMVAAANTGATASPLSTMTPPVFAADSRGKLVLNADTHANLEKLLLEENPEAMLANLDKASKSLPPQAAAELKVLAGQFQQYSKALTHTIPPETAPETEPEQLKMLDSLHSLRVTYLGAEAAQAMFGEEEAMTRKLVGMMAAQKDPNLTSEQKAERAQEMLNNLGPAKPAPAS